MAGLRLEEKCKLLGNVSIFSALSERELEVLGSAARTVSARPREEVFHKGDEGTQVYVVVSGKLKALTTSTDGDDVVFSILGPGEVFGEVALLGSSRRTATIAAIDECELLVLDRRDFLSFLKTNTDVAINLLRILAERLTRASELVEDTQFLSLPSRLAKKFAAFAHTDGEPGPSGSIRINLKLSQEEWGDLVGATRESVNKQLRVWSDQGIIALDRGYVILRDPEEMERLAGAVVI